MKRESKYSNAKKGDQKKISEMFSKVFGEKRTKRNR
jgi:hypothetical protein